MIIYPERTDLPDLAITWTASTGVPFDFSVGYNFHLDIWGVRGYTGIPVSFQKTPNSASWITAYPGNVSPNIVISWAIGDDIYKLPVGSYSFELTATSLTNPTSGKERRLRDTLLIGPMTSSGNQ